VGNKRKKKRKDEGLREKNVEAGEIRGKRDRREGEQEGGRREKRKRKGSEEERKLKIAFWNVGSRREMKTENKTLKDREMLVLMEI